MRTAIVLAAGSSRRFMGGNKLLTRVRGRPLVAHAVEAARRAPVGRIIVVLGHDAGRVAAAAQAPRVTPRLARDHRSGMAASLRTGLAALRPAERLVFVFLADTPATPRGEPARLLRALRPGDAAVRTRGRFGPGHPVLLRRPSPMMVRKLRGDQGLGALIGGRTRWLPSSRRRPIDIDTRRDLALWR